MQHLNMGLDFFKAVFLTTIGQLTAVLGVLFVFGLILYFLARFTRTAFVRSAGYKADVVWTGWLGTPVHELGHALFCVVFLHKIVDMKLYNPDPAGGTLGYVNHSYNPKSTYQKIGNFFIGAGPIILGSLVLYAAMYYLVPNQAAVFKIINSDRIALSGNFTALVSQFAVLFAMGKSTLLTLFSAANLQSWTFWLFIYISLCVASHMELSPADMKGMWSGLGTLVITLFVINFVAMLIGYDINKYIMTANSYLGLFIGLFIYAVIISSINFIVSFLGLSAYSLIRFRRPLNPFA